MTETNRTLPSNHQLLRALREIAKCLELAAAGQSIQLAAARGKVADVIDWQSGERPGCGCSECRSQRAAPETFVGRYDAKLDELANLPHGWDSYDGIPPRGDCLAKARQLAALLPEGHWDIVPMSNGGLQIEQHCGGLDIELMIEGARPELKAAAPRDPLLDGLCDHGLRIEDCERGCKKAYDMLPSEADNPTHQHAAGCPKLWGYECECTPEPLSTPSNGGPAHGD